MYRERIDKLIDTYDDEERQKYDGAVQSIANAIAALRFGAVDTPALPLRVSAAVQTQQPADVSEEQDLTEREDAVLDPMLG